VSTNSHQGNSPKKIIDEPLLEWNSKSIEEVNEKEDFLFEIIISHWNCYTMFDQSNEHENNFKIKFAL